MEFHKITLLLVALLAGAAYLASPRGNDFSQEKTLPQTTIRVLVRLVSIDVIVTDAKNAVVRDLKKENFQVFDNGHLQEIKHFRVNASNSPTSQPQSPLPGATWSPPQMADIVGARGMSAGPGANAISPNHCSPQAAAQMIAYVREMLAVKMAKAADTFSMANMSAQVRYELGYYPDGDNWDGGYRQIHVKVDRPGVEVISRQGYLPSDILPAPEVEEPLVRDRIAFAISQDTDSDEIPLKVSTAAAAAANGEKQIKIDLQIDARKVGFKSVGGRHEDRLHVAIFYADADGNYLGEERQTVNLQLQAETYQRFLKSGIPFSTAIPLKTPKQILRIIVYDVGSDRLGSKFVTAK